MRSHSRGRFYIVERGKGLTRRPSPRAPLPAQTQFD